MDDVMSYLAVAAKSLRRSPVFSGLVVLTLSVGIGATAAMFAVVDSVLLRPLGYPDADRLVVLDHPVPGQGADVRWELSVAGYFHFSNGMESLDCLGAYSPSSRNLSGDERPERVTSAAVTTSLLRILGARTVAGRLFTEDEDDPGTPVAALLSHGLWERRFGSDPGIVGRTIRVDGVPVPVVGVLEEGFDLPGGDVELWMPFQLDRTAEAQNWHYLQAIGRLATGTSTAEARAEMTRLTQRLPEVFPGAYSRDFMQNSGFSAGVRSLRSTVVGDVDRALWIIMAGVGLVLVVALANAVNLVLVRTEGRVREVAVHRALGAGRGDLARRFVVEGLVLASVAAASGLALAFAGVEALVAASPPGLPRVDEIGVRGRTVWATAGLMVVSGVLFGMVTLLRARHDSLTEGLGEGGRGRTSDRRTGLARDVLVMGQVAMALILLTASGLMLRSYQRLSEVDPGFDAEGLLTFRLSLPHAAYPGADAVYAMQRELLTRLREAPAIGAAGAVDALPIVGDNRCIGVSIGDAENPRGTGGCPQVRFASPGYFEAMGIELEAGRTFTDDDNDARTASLVVSRAMADRLWPAEDPLGQGVRLWGETFYRVVGVVGEVRHDGPAEPAPAILYFPLRAAPGENMPLLNAMSYVVRAPVTVDAVTAVRDVVGSLDPELPVTEARSMEEILSRSMIRVTFTLFLLGIAGTLALVLGLVGVYGVVAYGVSRRTSEFGIRMALGARGSSLLGMVLRQAALNVAIGAAAGLLLAWSGTRLLGSLLFEVSATDPGTFAAATAAMVGVSLVAAWLPARRATRIDPSEALRVE